MKCLAVSCSPAAAAAGSSCCSSRMVMQPVQVQQLGPQLCWRHQQHQHLHRRQTQVQPTPAVRSALAGGIVAATLLLNEPAYAATAAANFGTKCLGCHVNGGNIIQAGATLFPDDLAKNGVADSDSLYKLIYSGKGRMPGFGQECAPKLQCTFGPRLTDQEVQEMVQYVQDQAAAGWKPQQ